MGTIVSEVSQKANKFPLTLCEIRMYISIADPGGRKRCAPPLNFDRQCFVLFFNLVLYQNASKYGSDIMHDLHERASKTVGLPRPFSGQWTPAVK